MAADHDLAKEIDDVLALTKPDAFPEGTPVYRMVARWNCEIGDAACAVAQVVHEGDLEEIAEPLSEAAVEFYERFVQPQDIPGIPNFIETPLEESFKAMIPGIVADAIQAAAAGFQPEPAE